MLLLRLLLGLLMLLQQQLLLLVVVGSGCRGAMHTRPRSANRCAR